MFYLIVLKVKKELLLPYIHCFIFRKRVLCIYNDMKGEGESLMQRSKQDHNGNADKTTKEDAHIIIDVMHLIADIHAKSKGEKKLNEEIAVVLNLLIETLE